MFISFARDKVKVFSNTQISQVTESRLAYNTHLLIEIDSFLNITWRGSPYEVIYFQTDIHLRERQNLIHKLTKR